MLNSQTVNKDSHADFHHLPIDMLRMISMALGSLAFMVVLSEQKAPWYQWAWLFFCSFAWPLLAMLIVYNAKNKRRTERRCLLLDAFWMATLLPLSSFNMLPSILVATTITADRMQAAAYRLWFNSILVFVVGIVFMGLWTGFKVDYLTSQFVMIASMPFLIVHTMLVSYANQRLLLKVRAKNAALHQLSITDSLTKLYNSRYWSDNSENIFQQHKANHQPLTLLFIDCDNFKLMNDTFGHHTGDSVLRKVGQLLQAAQQQHHGIAARIGGDEFALLLTCDIATATMAARKLKKQMRKIGKMYAIEPKFSASIGLSGMQPSDHNFNDLFLRADTALYRAKNAGRNAIEVVS